MFPEGVPGVPQGVPPDMVKGYQPPPEAPPPVVEAKPARAEAEEDRRRAAPPQAPPPQQQMQEAPAAAPTTRTQPVQQGAGGWPTMPGAQPTWPADAQPAPTRCSANPPSVRAIEGRALRAAGASRFMSFTLAIVGRPNVGKSTLFNRLVGRRLALVDDRPGVTRDRREGAGRASAICAFTVVDTAGFDEAAPDSLTGRMMAQTEAAIAGADAVLFLIDVRAGLTPIDRAFADLVRRAGKPVIVVANKSEGRAGRRRRRGLRARPRRSDPDLGRARRGPVRSLRCDPRRACRSTPRCRPRRRGDRRRSAPTARSASRWSAARMSASRR